MRRGVVSLPSGLIASSDGIQVSSGRPLTVVDLNYFALYWDELVVPASDFIYLGIENEDSFIDSGFLKRPIIPTTNGVFTGGSILSIYSEAVMSFLDIKRKEDGDSHWSLNLLGDEFRLDSASNELKQSFRVELANVIPVPDTSVNINDILKFKSLRKAELDALNSYLDELYLEVVNSGDFNLSRCKALSRLEGAILDLEKLNKEGWRSPIRFDTSALFEANNGDIIAGLIGLQAIWQGAQGDVTNTILSGTTALLGAGFARLKPCFQSMKRKPNANIAYLSSAHKAKIIPRLF